MIQEPDYLSYLQATAPKDWVYENDHFRKIATEVDRCLRGEIDRLRIHMPPRHGKTETVTLRLVLFLLRYRPGVQICITGYNQRFANKLSLKIRNAYLSASPANRLSKDQAAKDDWVTDDGSRIVARGVGNPPTGEGFDFIIIDDPIASRKQADSATYRDAIYDWYVDGIYTRTAPECCIIGIWTRWHEDDLAGRLDEAEEAGGDQWVKLILPAIDEQGNALWPAAWPVEKLERKQRAMAKKDGSRAWLALFQQQPSPPDGTIYPVGSIRVISMRDVPADWQMMRAWDVGASENSGDWTVGVKIAFPKDLERIIIVHVQRGRYSTTDRDKVILSTARADGKECIQVLPADPAAAGKSQLTYWARMLQGLPFLWAQTRGRNKEVAARPIASQMGEGNVSMVFSTVWNSPFVEQLKQFQDGCAHDDDSDALADAYNKALELCGLSDDAEIACA